MEYVESEKVSVEFYEGARHSLYRSEEAGHPVYIPAPFIKIITPGNNNEMIDTPVDDTHRARFPVQWRNFMAGQNTEGVSGWKLDTWPAVNTAQVKTLQYMGVHTVEQLAGMSDSACQRVGMGTMELRIKAQAALKAAAGGAVTEQLATALKQRDDEIADLKAQFAMFMGQQAKPIIDKIEAAEPADTGIAELAAELAKPAKAKPGPKPKA